MVGEARTMGKSDLHAIQARNREIRERLDTDAPELIDELLSKLAFHFRRNWGKVAHLADDLAQRTLIAAYEQVDEFSDTVPFESWLFGIAHKVGLRAVRTHERHGGDVTKSLSELPEWDEPEAEDFAERTVGALYLAPYLERLDDEQRRLLHLRIYDERSWAEVADALGISVAAAEKRYERILKRLGQWMVDEEPTLVVRR